VAQYPAGSDFVAYADGKLFANRPDQTIAVIDAGTGKPVKSIAGLVHPGNPAVFDGSHTLWVPTYNSMTPVDTRSLKAGLPIRVPQLLGVQCQPMALGASLWITEGCDIPRGSPDEQKPGLLLRIDTRTKKVVQQKAVGQAPLAMTSGDGFLWVAGFSSGGITQIDLATGDEKHLDVASAPNGLLFSDGELWITDYGTRTVIEYDPFQHQTVNVAHLDSWAVDPLVGFGHIWVRLPTYEEVDEIDPGTGQVVAHISTGDMDPAALAVEDGAVWGTTAPPGSF